MKHSVSNDFFYQLIALLLAVIVVHAVYVTVIRPKANELLQERLERQAAGEVFEMDRSIYVVVRDFEQESCFILMLWAIAIVGLKTHTALSERRLLNQSLMGIEEGTRVLPEDVRDYARPLQALPDAERELLLPRVLLAALQRFGTTRNVQDVSSTVKEVCEAEADRLDAELSMVRYIVWAIPSIGFIGTVRGIGQALGQAHRAVEGDIVGITDSLGVAFNSTFIALVISVLLMFLMYQLQLLQERLVLDTQTYADANLLRHLAVR
jgi:biopolymer transport protein ExbB/TolQ